MTDRKPATRTLQLSEVGDQLPPMADEVAKGEIRVIVERSGSPIAALVSADDFLRWSQWDEQRRARLEVIDRMRAAFADVPTEEIEQEVEKALAEVRAEMTTERDKHARP